MKKKNKRSKIYECKNCIQRKIWDAFKLKYSKLIIQLFAFYSKLVYIYIYVYK